MEVNAGTPESDSSIVAAPAAPTGAERFIQLHSRPSVHLMILLVAFLHTHYHLPFAACALILHCIKLVFEMLGIATRQQNPIPTTLTTVFKQLKLVDRFRIYPICRHCWKLFQPDAPSDQSCCQLPVFQSCLRNFWTWGDASIKTTAHLVVPIQPLSDLLTEFLLRPGMEAEMERWAERSSSDGILSCIQDGNVWQMSETFNKKPFFSRHEVKKGELRIGVTIGMDW